MMMDAARPLGVPKSKAPADRVQQIKDIILASGDLPTLPLVALEVTRLAENPLTSAGDMVRLIRNDPSLTALILRVANSSYYGMPRRIDSLNTALVVLGMREISSLVTSISVVKTFPGREDEQTFDMQSFWEHSSGCAEIARMIAGKLQLHLHGAEFTAGLLHDVGKIVLDQHFHEDATQARELAVKNGISASEAERQVLGVDHAEIGAWLAETWSLPPTIAEAIRYHHTPHLASLNGVLTGVVHVADVMSRTIAQDSRSRRSSESLVCDGVWNQLAASNAEIRQLDVATFAAEVEENIRRARDFTRTTYD